MDGTWDNDVNMWQCLVGNFNLFGNFCLTKRTTIDNGFMINLQCTFLSKTESKDTVSISIFEKKKNLSETVYDNNITAAVPVCGVQAALTTFNTYLIFHPTLQLQCV